MILSDYIELQDRDDARPAKVSGGQRTEIDERITDAQFTAERGETEREQ
jgi:hypothetical protein